jgi:hypothetical protein
MRFSHRHLLLASVLALLVLGLLDVEWLSTYRYPVASPDFFVYYLAAKIGQAHGWATMYDAKIFLTAQAAVVGRPLPYLNPPELAWLVLPLSQLPYGVAVWIWRCVLAAAFLIAWLLAAPGVRAWKLVSGLAGAALLPVFISFWFGQVSLVIAAAVAFSWWLLKRERQWLAGLALAAIFLKPQAAFLVPIALLLAGYWRVFLGWAATTMALASVGLMAVGTSVVTDVAQSMSLVRELPGPIQMSLERQLPFPFGLMAAVLTVALFSLLSYGQRGRGPEIPLAAGLLTSVLVSPYINFYDLSGLMLASWLILRTRPERWQRTLALGVYVPVYLAPVAPLFSLGCLWSWLVSMIRLPAGNRVIAGPDALSYSWGDGTSGPDHQSGDTAA